jgi:2-oxoglutarate dehydrogenase E2 component (dihydrolipoamide succinyltransferase)
MILEVVIPNVAESITEVTLGTWLVKDGDYVQLDQPICEVETDKASQELIAEKAGKISLVVSEGDDVAVGGLIAKIDTDAPAPAKTETVETPKVEVAAPVIKDTPKVEKVEVNNHYAAQTPSPSAKRVISENNLDASKISGTGKDGRITKDDTFNEVNMQPIMDIRTKYKDKFKEIHGVNLGFMSFFTKACSLALMKFPEVNAYIDVEKGELIYHNYTDISIAVSTPKGLVVPVIRNAESLTMDGIEKAVLTLAKKGRDGQLTMEDMDGGTFTITNGGVFGSLMSTPIINPPQSAILGMHKIQDRPMVENGQIIVRPMMYLALSYDHRIIDGKESVGFLVTVKDYLENPEKMLIGTDPVEALLML